MNRSVEHKFIYTLRVCATYATIWPLDSKAGKCKIFFCKIFWWICMLNMINQFYLIDKNIFPLHQKNFAYAMKSLVELIYSSEILFNLLYSNMQKKRLLKLLFEIEHSDKIWTSCERTVQKKVMQHAFTLSVSLLIMHTLGTLAFFISPIITGRIFPVNFVYPFQISNYWIFCVVYAHNAFGINQAWVTVIFDIMIIIILWHIVFKFNLIGMQMRSVCIVDKQRSFIIIYQNILSYVQETNHMVSYLIFKLTIVTFLYILSCCLLILNKATIMEISQFCVIACLSIGRLFICCWSAQAVTDMAYNVSLQVYDSPWMYISSYMRKNIFMIMQSCQKPVVFSASNILPVVSIKLFGQILSTSFSYLMTLRAVLHE